MNERRPDVLIIGAGPAGLTAATYLARFRRQVLVADGGTPPHHALADRKAEQCFRA